MWEADLNYEFLKQMSELEQRRMYQYCPDMKPEANKYEVKTRRPRNSENIKINTLRRVRETELHQEAMKASRIKCKEFADLFVKCSQINPRKETSKCQKEFLIMKKCMQDECEVEMDKRRRDMTRNKEWWWKVLYNAQGEHLEQLKPDANFWGIFKHSLGFRDE